MKRNYLVNPFGVEEGERLVVRPIASRCQRATSEGFSFMGRYKALKAMHLINWNQSQKQVAKEIIKASGIPLVQFEGAMMEIIDESFKTV